MDITVEEWSVSIIRLKFSLVLESERVGLGLDSHFSNLPKTHLYFPRSIVWEKRLLEGRRISLSYKPVDNTRNYNLKWRLFVVVKTAFVHFSFPVEKQSAQTGLLVGSFYAFRIFFSE